ncbi:MAG: hypothetical protein Q9184_008325, partial [Pyrenodesmia sp. 2 TL-2023]
SSASSSSSSEHDNDMLASMGFSSFGAQPRPKKQKTSHPPTSSKNASGGNQMPLGKRKPAPVPGPRSGSGAARVGRGGAEGMDTRTAMAQGLGVVNAGEEDEYVRGEAGDGDDDGLLRKRKEEVRGKIDALTAAVPGEGNEDEKTLARKEEEDMEEVDKGERSDGFEGKSWREWKQGVRGEGGVVAFFDWSFVEDPWERLRERGRIKGEQGEGRGER